MVTVPYTWYHGTLYLAIYPRHDFPLVLTPAAMYTAKILNFWKHTERLTRSHVYFTQLGIYIYRCFRGIYCGCRSLQRIEPPVCTCPKVHFFFFEVYLTTGGKTAVKLQPKSLTKLFNMQYVSFCDLWIVIGAVLPAGAAVVGWVVSCVIYATYLEVYVCTMCKLYEIVYLVVRSFKNVRAVGNGRTFATVANLCAYKERVWSSVARHYSPLSRNCLGQGIVAWRVQSAMM